MLGIWLTPTGHLKLNISALAEHLVGLWRGAEWHREHIDTDHMVVWTKECTNMMWHVTMCVTTLKHLSETPNTRGWSMHLPGCHTPLILPESGCPHLRGTLYPSSQMEHLSPFYPAMVPFLVWEPCEHIFLLETSISKNRMKQNDKNLSELELKSFLYMLHKQNICTKMDLVISFSILNRFGWTKD